MNRLRSFILGPERPKTCDIHTDMANLNKDLHNIPPVIHRRSSHQGEGTLQNYTM